MKNFRRDCKVGVLGAAFNPPHLGHIDVVRQVLDAVDLVVLVPSYSHPWGKQMASFEDRIAMLKLIVIEEGLGERVTISEIERSISESVNGPVYTYDVMSSLSSQHVDNTFAFICGPDNRDNWSRFYRSADIERKWGLIVAEERLQIRSTLIRGSLKAGCYEVEGLPSSVAEYAVGKRLYV